MARPRLHDDGYLAFLRTKPCCICGKVGETEACHIRIGFRALGKKPDDRYATPMCHDHHMAQHSISEEEFWRVRGLDPFAVAERFYVEYGGEGGRPKRKRTTIKPRLPKHERTKIKGRSSWPKRTLPRKSAGSLRSRKSGD